MKVFIAGATGAIGHPLVRSLLASGYEVFGMTRSKENASALAHQGAEPVLVDVFDADSVRSSMYRIKPAVVIDQLTSLPKTYSWENMRKASSVDTRTRLEGGANLLTAAQAARVKRYLIQSAAFFYAPAPGLADEDAPFAFDGSPAIAANTRTFAETERRTISATNLESIILRYGFFYGPGTWYDREGNVADQIRKGEFPIIGNGEGVWSFVHVQDAAEATVTALRRGNAGVYNIVDDNPSKESVWLPAFANWLGAPPPPLLAAEVADADSVYMATSLRGAANDKAKRDLQWKPRNLEWLLNLR
jgi:nucleoside-diphosphate-sugar epimerase